MDPVTRLFAVPELQDRIFSYNGRKDAAKCAQVCQGWLEIALDRTWRDLPAVQPLLRLLAPLEYRENANEDLMFQVCCSQPLRYNSRLLICKSSALL